VCLEVHCKQWDMEFDTFDTDQPPTGLISDPN
jgi:hypothetical protein